MTQSGHQPRLVLKALIDILATYQPSMQHFDRVQATAAHVPGDIDRTDGASAKEALDPIGFCQHLTDDIFVPIRHDRSLSPARSTEVSMKCLQGASNEQVSWTGRI